MHRARQIAAAQDGAIATRQLLDAGLSSREIAGWVERGLLTRRHRGAYLLGAVAGPWFSEFAALLACGPLAVLSHATSLAVWRVRDAPPAVHVTRPWSGHRHTGVVIHRCDRLDAADRAVVRGLAVTAPARTLVDVAATMTPAALGRLVEDMQRLELVSAAELFAALERGHGRSGALALRAVLDRDSEPSLTRSEAERRLLDLIRAARLPAPQTNVRVGHYEVDFLWAQERLVIEVDGFAFHGSRAAFERDRARDADLQARGYRVVRLTWRRIVDEPMAVVAELAALLSSRS
ncbi:MAG: hypothetical protein QOE28_1580 [Solirubrobacteraceae bacterium]|nr:hypothetical protein [Solirubrobacteraceae bacterium]